MSQGGALATLCAMRLVRFGLPLALVLAAGCLRTLSADGPLDGDDQAEDSLDLPPQATPDAALLPLEAAVPTTPTAPAPTVTLPPISSPITPLLPPTLLPGTGTPIVFPTLPIAPATPEQIALCGTKPIASCTRDVGCNVSTDNVVEALTGCPTGEKRSSCSAGTPFCGLFGSVITKDASGRHYRSNAGCVPSDLTPVSPQPVISSDCKGPSAEADAACAQHGDRETCLGDARWWCRPVLAGRFDPQLLCFDPAPGRGLFLACVPSAKVDGQLSHFRDAEGQAWQVSDLGRNAIPASWQPIDAASVLPGSSSLGFHSCYRTFL
jgi:hypothetical protein